MRLVGGGGGGGEGVVIGPSLKSSVIMVLIVDLSLLSYQILSDLIFTYKSHHKANHGNHLHHMKVFSS